jgi:hypothetical protein
VGKKAPSSPDPVATAQAQGQANAEAVRESAKVNAVNQYTPYGSITYQKDANGVPISQTSSLTPLQQQALDQQNQLATVLGGKALEQSGNLPQDKYSLDQFGALPTNADFTAQGKQVQDAFYGKQMGMLDPTFTQESRALEQNIANRGLPIAGEAAKTLEDNQARRQNDARQQAAMSAILAGGNEQTRLYNQSMQNRTQGINEYNATRQQPFNELSAYLQGQPIFQAPSAGISQYQVAPADVAGNIYQNYNAQNQQYQNNLNGMYGLGAAGASAAIPLMFSDKRLKANIKRIGRLNKKVSIYSFRYVGSKVKQLGVMAQEVLMWKPKGVVMHPSGYLMVNYSEVFNG